MGLTLYIPFPKSPRLMRLVHFYGHTGGAPIAYFRFKIFYHGSLHRGGNFRIYTDRKIEKISVTTIVNEGGVWDPSGGLPSGAAKSFSLRVKLVGRWGRWPVARGRAALRGRAETHP